MRQDSYRSSTRITDTAACAPPASPSSSPTPVFRQSQRSRSISFNREGPDVVHELIFPNYKAYRWPICALAAQALPARDVV
jgi:hypothetical protein